MLFSCKQNTSPTNASGIISATVNDTAITFNTNATALYLGTNGKYNLVISGFAGTTGTSNEISISIGGGAPVGVGTYNDTGVGADKVTMLYGLPSGASDFATRSDATVTITSLTSTNVQGTFSGVLSNYTGRATKATKAFASGKFNLQIKQ